MAMRVIAVVLAVTSGTVGAAPTLSEFGRYTSGLAPAEQLVVAGCDLDVELRGAIADVQQRARIVNQGPNAIAGVLEFELPAGAKLVGASLGNEPAVMVAAPIAADLVVDDTVLAADPVVVEAIGGSRYRAIVEPLDPDHEAALVVHWTAIAAIHDGELRLTFPSQPTRCRASLHATAGPGSRISRIRSAGVEIGARGAATFAIDRNDVPIEVELAFDRAEPVAWLQSEPTGDGGTSQAITIVAPPARSTSPRRALLVVDGSRSMELVGKPNISKLIRGIANALPSGSEVEAIVYDRTPTRVLGAWKPADATSFAAIEAAVAQAPARNGSDLAAALALAHDVVADRGRTQPMVIIITDGVLGAVPEDSLVRALAAKASDIDVHAIVVEPARLQAPNADAIRAPVTLLGGTYVEVGVDELDGALAGLASWLRPSWLGLAIEGVDLPGQLLAGDGIVVTRTIQNARPLQLVAHREAAVAVPVRSAGVAPLAELVEKRPSVDEDHALVVLATAGRVATSRRAMIAGGGPFRRMRALADPAFPPQVAPGATTVAGGSSLDRGIIERMLQLQLERAAYVCYQRALARVPKLAGTARLELEIARGEIVHASTLGLGDAAFDACLVDAVYGVSPPLPNPAFNLDDRVVVTYPLTFSIREDHPYVVPGDADSSTPIDIDAIQPRGKVRVDTSTPLGNLRP